MNRSEQFLRFEEMGVWHVRMLTPAWNGPLQSLAFEWLKLKDQEERLRIEASQAEQNRIALIAKNAAMIAAIAAIIAVVLAIISNVIALLAWEHPMH